MYKRETIQAGVEFTSLLLTWPLNDTSPDFTLLPWTPHPYSNKGPLSAVGIVRDLLRVNKHIRKEALAVLISLHSL